MHPFIEIGNRRVGPGYPVYLVAEMSANHAQDFDRAVQIVRAAKEAGADAIKLQTYTPDTITIDSDKEYFRIKGTLWDGAKLYELYKKAYTPWEWHPRLKEVAHEVGLDFFSTPFDETAVDFLEGLEVPVYKVASFENVDLPLIQKIARKGKPIILSTGMATLAEIDEAVSTVRSAQGSQMALLKCTSAYPAPAEEMNLRTIPHMAQAFGMPIGLSDHSEGFAVPIAAVSLGATIIEKHFTLSRATPGPDSTFSLEPQEFKTMAESIRIAERALGTVRYGVNDHEARSRVFRRSLFVVKNVRAGEQFTPENIRSIRPSDGLHTRYVREVVGRTATRDIEEGTPLTWDLVGGERE